MTKITKTIARKKFDNGDTITLVPSKMAPGGCWNVGIPLSKNNERTFDELVNEFKFYNCSKETGLGVAFYI